MFRLSKMADYAVILLAYMSSKGKYVVTAPELSDGTSLPQPAVAKILKALVRSNILESKRGIQGGYVLQRCPTQISIAEVIQAMEGPVAVTDCVDNHTSSCASAKLCPMSGRWQAVNNAIEQALASVRLSEVISPVAYIHPLNRWTNTAHMPVTDEYIVTEYVMAKEHHGNE